MAGLLVAYNIYTDKLGNTEESNNFEGARQALLLKEIEERLKDLPSEKIEGDPILLKKFAELLTHKFGTDKESFGRISEGFERKKKLYSKIFEAFEEQMIEGVPITRFKN